MRIHKYYTDWTTQEDAIAEFNRERIAIEEMHQANIKVIRMYKPILCSYYVVEYVLQEDNQ